MIFLTMMTFIIMMISNIMMYLSIILSKKSSSDREKSSPFECGFDPKAMSRIPFSLHFFLITVIFLIFDVEIALILPLIMTSQLTNFMFWMFLSTFFFLILLLGTYHEWNQNMLNWSN